MPSPNSSSPPTVLILGGGIHGAAVARELVLNGLSVVLADSNDLAAGATSKSSRLIHGGVRYLEYGDVRLVRESLVERQRLLSLAPQFTRPLRLFVPTQYRWTGLLRSVLGFFRLSRTRLGRRLMGRGERRAPRGYWPVRLGLWMYDVFSWGDGLPKSRGSKIGASAAGAPRPRVNESRYRWLCEYCDAQMRYPERCVLALLADAEQTARQRGLSLQVVPYAKLCWRDRTIEVADRDSAPVTTLTPGMVVNCSGAWGDLTLKGIDPATTPLFAGTKGSHLVTRHAGLKSLLGEHGVYAETGDRRLAFILPFGDAVLVGTTDERFAGPPEDVVASEQELNYLRDVVAGVFGLTLMDADIECHYSGVRPLPRTTDTTNAAISRDHSLAEHCLHGVPILTLVGGKLTTFRSVSEQICDRVLKRLGRQRTQSTAGRTLIGGEDFPRDPSQWPDLWTRWAAEFHTTVDEVELLWPLYGMRTRAILDQVSKASGERIAESPLRRSTVRWVIDHEWVSSLQDLVERRLMLVFASRLSRSMLQDLADCLVEAGRLPAERSAASVDAAVQRLRVHYGRILRP